MPLLWKSHNHEGKQKQEIMKKTLCKAGEFSRCSVSTFSLVCPFQNGEFITRSASIRKAGCATRCSGVRQTHTPRSCLHACQGPGFHLETEGWLPCHQHILIFHVSCSEATFSLSVFLTAFGVLSCDTSICLSPGTMPCQAPPPTGTPHSIRQKVFLRDSLTLLFLNTSSCRSVYYCRNIPLGKGCESSGHHVNPTLKTHFGRRKDTKCCAGSLSKGCVTCLSNIRKHPSKASSSDSVSSSTQAHRHSSSSLLM
ncbi:uncharacterized protein ACIQIH_009252 [Cyanocitta cristata]